MALTRRTLFTVGGLAATGALAACGSNNGRSPAPGGGDATAPTISSWYHKYGEDGVEAAVKKWAAAYPSAKVNVNWVLADYEKSLSAALLTPTAPDVFENANGPTLDMIKAGQVVDVTDVIGPAKAQFTPTVLARMAYQDKIWAVPQTVDTQLLYYRKSALAARGLQPPATLEELTHVAATIATPEMGGFFAGQDGGVSVLGLPLLWSAGLSELSADNKKATFNDPALYATITAFKTLFDSPGMVKSASADWSDASPFINGETAMQWGGLWDLTKVLDAHSDDVGVCPFPASGATGKQVVPFGAFSACVLAKSAHVTAAKNYVKWLWVDSDDKQVEFSNAFGVHIPAKPALFSKATKVAYGPGADAAKFVTDLGRSNALFWTAASAEAYSTAVSNVVKNGADPAAEFKAASDKVDAELRRVNG